MASLYELTEDYKELLAMAEDEELDSELLADTLEGIEGSIEEKAEASGKIIKSPDRILTGQEEMTMNRTRRMIRPKKKKTRKIKTPMILRVVKRLIRSIRSRW